MHNYQNLKLWQKARAMVKEAYRLIGYLPKEELYGLASQMKRSAISVPSNIAEGAGRNSRKEFLYFLSISQGSCYELETQLSIAIDLGHLEERNAETIFEDLQEIEKMNRSFQQTLLKSND